MLISLSIRNVVLIDSLDLSFDKGLSVFTGETGAGKSILLDSLNLSLGVRADSGLVRHGADKLSVTAEFSIDENHSSRKILKEHDLDTEDETLILRRVVNSDGRSKAFVNDQPVSIGILRTLGNTLIEIHGQFERHSLINPATHCGVLDKYGELDGLIEECRTSWNSWQVKIKQKETAENALSKAGEEEDFLRHAV
ncbi:MAG: AAA family ATPase [Alphaproteobacteria bacterium]|nr:AAA family ATPase [Alphaproteobacteria bacterium]